MSDYPPATLLGALAALLFDGKATPRTRWAFLVAVLALKANRLPRANRLSLGLYTLAARIGREAQQ